MDGQPLSLHLSGNAWFILLVRGMDRERETEDFAHRLIQAVRAELGADRVQLYLEVPENHMIIFIVTQDAHAHTDVLAQKLQTQGLMVWIKASVVCYHTAHLAGAWSQLIQPAGTSGSIEMESISEMLEAFRNALEFEEQERIRFTLTSICDTLDEVTDPSHAYALGYETLYLARRWFENQKDEEGIRQVRCMVYETTGSMLTPQETIRKLLQQLSVILTTHMAHKEDAESDLIQDIVSYLENHYRDPNFTVQQTADIFQLSISNLSHYFKNHIGISVSDYVEQLRIQTAQKLLVQTTCSISQIAGEIGYAQPATFMRAFKKVCGISPSAYRASGKATAADVNS